MGGVPSVPRDESRRVEVIVAGYSRTGTSSMQLALEKLLNGSVLHGGTQILHREDAYCKKWAMAYDAKRRGDKPALLGLLRELTAGFAGVADQPPINFVPELMELYPEAKVILTTRDPARWEESMAPLALNSTKIAALNYLLSPIPGWRWFPKFIDEFSAHAQDIVKNGPAVETELPAVGPEPQIPLLLKWNRFIQDIVPEEKLLVTEVSKGWEPMCQFLGVAVPDEPLPHANETAASTQIAIDAQRKILQVWGAILGAATLAGFGAWRVWRSL